MDLQRKTFFLKIRKYMNELFDLKERVERIERRMGDGWNCPNCGELIRDGRSKANGKGSKQPPN